MKTEIRSKLQNGSTIQNICNEYHLTFNALWDIFKNEAQGQGRPKRKNLNKHLYITERDGKFFIRKNDVFYGTYKTLEDAIKVRDYFIYSRWDIRNLDKVCEELGVERIRDWRVG